MYCCPHDAKAIEIVNGPFDAFALQRAKKHLYVQSLTAFPMAAVGFHLDLNPALKPLVISLDVV